MSRDLHVMMSPVPTQHVSSETTPLDVPTVRIGLS